MNLSRATCDLSATPFFLVSSLASNSQPQEAKRLATGLTVDPTTPSGIVVNARELLARLP